VTGVFMGDAAEAHDVFYGVVAIIMIAFAAVALLALEIERRRAARRARIVIRLPRARGCYVRRRWRRRYMLRPPSTSIVRPLR